MKLLGAIILLVAIALAAIGSWGLFDTAGREEFSGRFAELGAIVPAAMVFAAPFLMLVGLAMLFLIGREDGPFSRPKWSQRGDYQNELDAD